MGETFFWGKRKCRWRTEIRTASNKQNWRKHCKNSSNCAWKLSADCQERSRASEINRETVRKILTWGRCVQKWSQKSSPKNKSKEESQFAKTFRRGKMTFWALSSQVMKHGPTNTTLKRSGKVHNERLPVPHDQKISVSPNQEPKQCCWLFLILEGLFIMNLYQLDKQSTKFTIWKYWKKVRWKWPELFANNSWILHNNNAPAQTALSVREFLATKQITVLEHPTYSLDLAPSDFSIPEDKGNIERKAFWWHWWHQE